MTSIFKINKFKRMGEYPRITDKYYRYRQEETFLFDEKTFKTVPLDHTQEFKNRQFFKGFNVKDLTAITGKVKNTGRWKLQSILIPRELIGR
jgi:hypothetical protein